MAAKLFRGPNDGDNEGIVNLVVERLQTHYDGLGMSVEVESAQIAGIHKEPVDWDRQFSVTVGVMDLSIPGGDTDLDKPDRRTFRRLGSRQVVFDVNMMALVTDRGGEKVGEKSSYNEAGFWNTVTSVAVVLSEEIFGPGTRKASVVYSDSVPSETLKDFGIGLARYMHFVIPAYFSAPTSTPIYSQYTGVWPPEGLWLRTCLLTRKANPEPAPPLPDEPDPDLTLEANREARVRRRFDIVDQATYQRLLGRERPPP